MVDKGFKRIPVQQLRLGMYVHEFCGSWMEHPFWRSKFMLRTEADLQRVIQSGIKDLWIDPAKGCDVEGGVSETEVREEVERELEFAASMPMPLDTVESTQAAFAKATALYRSAKPKIASMFNEARLGRAVDAGGCLLLVDEISESVMRNPGALISVVRLKQRDDYTYMHSVAVCALMVALGRALGLEGEALRQIGLAGMMHDIGKVAMPLDVLNKPGKLTDEEFTLIRLGGCPGACHAVRRPRLLRPLLLQRTRQHLPHGLREFLEPDMTRVLVGILAWWCCPCWRPAAMPVTPPRSTRRRPAPAPMPRTTRTWCWRPAWPMPTRATRAQPPMRAAAAFLAAHGVSPGDFTRRRKLSVTTVTGFLMQLVGGQALQESLDGFFMALLGQAHVMRHVTKSAFSQARKKLRTTAFSALNRQWVQGWLGGVGAESWCGLRVLAADGCCLRLPARAENCVRFGPGPQEDGSVPMARCVGLYAVAARQFLEMVVGRYDQGERGLLLQALGSIKPVDVLVLDRGYPARWLFAVLHARDVNDCVRIEGCVWTVVQALVRSRGSESVVSLKLTGKDRQHWAEHGQPGAAPRTVKVRLVKVILPNGKLQIMATSLMDTRAYPAVALAISTASVGASRKPTS